MSVKFALKYILPNFKVLVDQVEATDMENIKAFHAKFYDNGNYPYASVGNNEYWMRVDYDSAVQLSKTLLTGFEKCLKTQIQYSISFNG